MVEPRRPLNASKTYRWITNLGIIGIVNGLSNLLMMITPIVIAGFAETKGWGLLSLTSLPVAAKVIAGIIVLDFTVYLQHVLSHKTHHMDLDLDVTSDMHRAHHSVIRRETDSNFGFNIPWWDRLLGTCTGCSLFPFFPYPKQSGQHREILTRFKCSI